jgi:hypothetical protein
MSAWAYPEARSMMTVIVVGSMVRHIAVFAVTVVALCASTGSAQVVREDPLEPGKDYELYTRTRLRRTDR